MKNYWVNEYVIVKNDCKGDLIEHVTRLSENNGIENRFTVLMLGILCEKHARAYVDVWLENLRMDRLTRRNMSDAPFLYAYEALREAAADMDEREELFVGYLKEYFEWKDKHGSISTFSDAEVSNRNNLYSDIITFGDLYERLERNSKPTQTGTMLTIRTDKDAMEQLDKIIAKKGSISAFLDYLNEDDSVRDYNRKSTLYAQKMLYSILKYGIDLLCKHNLPSEDDRRSQYIEAVDYVLRDEYKSYGAFSRFMKYNRIFLKTDNDNFRNWLKANKENLTVGECIDYLRDSKIYYNRLFTNFYYYLVGELYDVVEKEMTQKGKEQVYKTTQFPEEAYEIIFGESIQYKNRIMRYLKNVFSGNAYVSRTFLIIFGLYAGYDEDKLNKALRESGYDELSPDSIADKEILEIDKFEIMKSIRDTVNTVKFLSRIEDREDERKEEYVDERGNILYKSVGKIERDDFQGNISDFSDAFKRFSENADDEDLKGIFNGEFTKRTIDDFSEKEVKRLKK